MVWILEYKLFSFLFIHDDFKQYNVLYLLCNVKAKKKKNVMEEHVIILLGINSEMVFCFLLFILCFISIFADIM